MLVFKDIHWQAAWHNARHPVWRHPRARKLCHTDGHALAAEAVGEPGDNRGDDLGVGMGVAAQLVAATIDSCAKDGALRQDVLQSKALGFPTVGFRLGQLELGFLDPEGPFKGLLDG
jgi:hypothetical protein